MRTENGDIRPLTCNLMLCTVLHFFWFLEESYTPSSYRCHNQSLHGPLHLLDHPSEISGIYASFISSAHIRRGPGIALGQEFADPRLQPRLGPSVSAEIPNP